MENSKKKIIIFSDLDGTLLDHKTYSYTDAKNALKKISDQKIPLILVSSKTSAEMLKIIDELNQDGLKFNHPFICENGSAIYVPKNYFNFNIAKEISYQVKNRGKFKEIKISDVNYQDLVKILKKIEKNIDAKIIGFNDLTAKQLSNECGLKLEDAKSAKTREFDEPFRIDPDDPNLYQKIEKMILEKGLNYTKGGRYAHIMGRQDKGLAVKLLSKLFKKKYQNIKTIGFGDSKNDLEFLGICDQGYLVSNPKKPTCPELVEWVDASIKSDKINRISEIGPKGFNKVVLKLISNCFNYSNF